MTQKEANKIVSTIEKTCEEHGLWVEIKMVKKPDLKDIVITVSVRITEK